MHVIFILNIHTCLWGEISKMIVFSVLQPLMEPAHIKALYIVLHGVLCSDLNPGILAPAWYG